MAKNKIIREGKGKERYWITNASLRNIYVAEQTYTTEKKKRISDHQDYFFGRR